MGKFKPTTINHNLTLIYLRELQKYSTVPLTWSSNWSSNLKNPDTSASEDGNP
jgi:hypothetical protein